MLLVSERVFDGCAPDESARIRGARIAGPNEWNEEVRKVEAS